MKLLRALENRNRCLKKIADSTELLCSQLLADDFTGLNSFELRRNNAIKTLMLIDNLIQKLTKTLPSEEKNEEFKSIVRKMLEISSSYIYYITEIDNTLMNKLADEKHKLLLDLASVEQNKKTVSKFRSESARKSGGYLDGII
jgi:hypothetical protein